MSVAIFAGVLLGTSCFAESVSFQQKIDVTSSEPIYKNITTRTPYEECWDDVSAVSPEESSSLGALIGGVAGGILGNQIGKGRGKTAATVGGALVGVVIGNNIDNSNGSKQRKCVVKFSETSDEKLIGYKNIGNYNGHIITKYSNTPLKSFVANINVLF